MRKEEGGGKENGTAEGSERSKNAKTGMGSDQQRKEEKIEINNENKREEWDK